MKWSDLGLGEKLINRLNEKKFISPTPIQETAIDVILNNKNAIIASETGSGKTLAYLLPIIQKMYANESEQKIPKIITAPTRELSRQIYEVAKSVVDQTIIKVGLAIGGREIESDFSSCNIIIGTPHRIRKVYETANNSLINTNTLVIDESDAIFELGYFEDTKFLIEKMRRNVQFICVSATINNDFVHFFKTIVKNHEILLSKKRGTSQNVRHFMVSLQPEPELNFTRLIQAINPYFGIVFANTKKEADDLYRILKDKNINVAKLHAGLEARERKNVFSKLLKNEYQILVATDLAARGWDLPNVTHVFSYNLPQDLNWYAHRAGRTGRNEATGNSYILYENKDTNLIKQLERKKIELSLLKVSKDLQIKAVELKRKKPQRRSLTKEEIEIRKVVSSHSKKVKPNYKKDLRLKIEAIKKKKRKELIEADFKKKLLVKWKSESRAKRIKKERGY